MTHDWDYNSVLKTFFSLYFLTKQFGTKLNHKNKMTFFSYLFLLKVPNLPKRILQYIKKIKARQEPRRKQL